ncbi:MAG TPA: hypothetical protein VEW46_03260 [Pyrinomonadaceae bacterium]|nr:hypothetical protein [Pyrinomonadaceae bacterium]
MPEETVGKSGVQSRESRVGGFRVASFKSFEEIHAWQKAREAKLYALLDEVSRMTLRLAQHLRSPKV